MATLYTIAAETQDPEEAKLIVEAICIAKECHSGESEEGLCKDDSASNNPYGIVENDERELIQALCDAGIQITYEGDEWLDLRQTRILTEEEVNELKYTALHCHSELVLSPTGYGKIKRVIRHRDDVQTY